MRFFFYFAQQEVRTVKFIPLKVVPPPQLYTVVLMFVQALFILVKKKKFPATVRMAIWTPMPGLVLTKRSSGVLMFNCVMHVTFWSCLTDKMDISHVTVKTAPKLRNEKLLINFCSSWLFKSTRWCWTNRDGFDVSPSQGNPVMVEHKKAVGSGVCCG
jgi:hypothetical protein